MLSPNHSPDYQPLFRKGARALPQSLLAATEVEPAQTGVISPDQWKLMEIIQYANQSSGTSGAKTGKHPTRAKCAICMCLPRKTGNFTMRGKTSAEKYATRTDRGKTINLYQAR